MFPLHPGQARRRWQLASLPDAVIVEAGGDETETLLSYGIIDQLQPGMATAPGTDPMAAGARLLDLLDQWQGDGQVVVLVIDDLQWADRPSSRAVLFARGGCARTRC